jgi:ribosomal protein S12 methylthiotransferase
MLREAEKLVAAGVKELLVVSQDTSAYGIDLKYATSPWKDREVRAKFYDLRKNLANSAHGFACNTSIPTRMSMKSSA